MAKNKKKKTIIPKLFGVILLCMALYLLVGASKSLIRFIELRNQKDEVQRQLAALKEENESLNSTKTKLEDDEYIQTYARGELMLSKADEKVYYLPSKN